MRLLTMALLVALLVGCKPAQPPPAQADWTLLFYADADNDLEDSTIRDLRSLLEIGSTERVQLVVLCDRSPLDSSHDGYSNERVLNLEDWTTAKLLHLGHDQVQELEDWGEVNMAEPATLARFLKTGVKLYPARHYALFLWDHGAGWEGMCADD
ncbi:MAG: hypothetical protein KC910_19085, partial [Candidatus Eremiobacteraeota bacterium]|nr:hypothetical protein [Candidatus Eremiobacteraeota bacterium]